MMEQSYFIGDDDRVKALPGNAANQDTIANDQRSTCRGAHKDCGFAVLYEEQILIGARITDRRLKGHRKLPASLCIGQGVNDAQRR